ncbi:thioredoxin-like domain-containing protein [Echinicola sp. 20G]|uniref:TlpA family protein disulfide reductase n=1 Tax=Echinicola sp. 20G TaxID=2781961 RepID=UPI001910B0E9|nr:thioredoxin-like domain-containing protein [Echinicola sp. 20G]
MKALTKNCFLALLCLLGSETYAQVASPHTAPGGSQGAPMVVYGEIKSNPLIEEVEVVFWEHFLYGRTDIPAPLKQQLPTERGHLFNGSMGAMTFGWESPAFAQHGWLSIRHDGHTYLDQYHVSPGDSVRILIDLNQGRLLFDGPDAGKFRCQYDLSLALANAQYRRTPIMYTDRAEALVKDPRYRDALDKASSIHPLIRFVGPKSKGMAALADLLGQDISKHPAWKVLDQYRGAVPEELIQVLEADTYGQLLGKKVGYLKRNYEKGPKALALYKNAIAPLPEDHIPDAIKVLSIPYMDYLLDKNTLRSVVENTSVTQLYGQYSPVVHDLLYGKYLARYFRKFEDPNNRFDLGLEAVETPWIRETIGQLYEAQKIGSTVSDIPLLDGEGNPVSLRDFKGKTVLVDFWFTGCKPCMWYFEGTLKPVESQLRTEEDILIVSISADKDKQRWKKSIGQGKFTSSHVLNLHAPGFDHPLLEYYSIRSFPTQMLINAEGQVSRIGQLPTDPDQLLAFLKFMSNS